MFKAVAFLAFAAIGFVNAKVYFQEDFNDDAWKDRWVVSEWKEKEVVGEWKHTAGEWFSDENDKGIKTGEDARFYAISAKMGDVLNNEDKDLAIGLTVKHEQNIDCGGAYIKLLPSGLDQSKFGGESEYRIMFGPDICGSNKKTHAILHYPRKEGDELAENVEHKTNIKCETDHHAHFYSFILKKDGTYDVKIDGKSTQSGSIAENWKIQPEKEINDPSKSKPLDWVDEKKIADPEDKKPDDWDNTPKQIPDPEAQKPEDWDDEDDGEWEAPMIDNPEYKGEWEPKLIDNPDYIGEWEHPKIPNPAYFEDDKMYARCPDCEYVGFELWQVKAGTLFDDIIVTDSVEELEEMEKKAVEKNNAILEVKKEIEAEKIKKIEEEEKKAEEEEERREAEEDAKAAAGGDDNGDEDDDVVFDDDDADEPASEKDEL